MASRVKEEEKNERIIRGLLKLPENRRCINCNSLGPQYVCTSFWTFVCTTCSGIHREFTHRVKSVSMATFTTQEVVALQEGGNLCAREIYLKEWDSQRQSGPDGSNVDRLRDFIKHVYVDRRYSGERSSGKPPNTKMGEKEDPYENRRSETYDSASRSPPYDPAYERRYSEMSSPGARSDNSRYSYDDRKIPGHDQESRQYNDFRRSPARPEIVNDWRREDRFGNGLKGEDCRISDGDSRLESQSPERPKEVSTPPVVRPVREILGDNVVPLRVIEPPKTNVPKVANGSAQTQRTASSSSLESTNENRVEVKMESLISLIDFDADPEPPAVGTMPHVQQATQPHSVTQPASAPIDNNWASFDFGPQVQVSQAPNIANPMESVLSRLSVSSSVPSQVPTAPGGSGGSTALPCANIATLQDTSGSSTAFSSILPVTSSATFHPGVVSAITPGQAPAIPVNGGLWPSVHQQQQTSVFLALGGQSTLVTSSLGGDSGNQNMFVSQNVRAAFGMPSSGAPPILSSPAPAVTSAVVYQAAEIKPSRRKELPEDLFAAAYLFYPASVPGWQTGPPRAPGYSMQYPVATPIMPTFIQRSKSVNPFDASEPVQAQVLAQAHNFPSMVSLQGALPNIPPSSGLHRPSSLGSPSPAWMPPVSSTFPSALSSHSTAYASGMPARPYVMQQLPNNMPLPGHQVMGGLGVEGAALGAVHMDQQASRLSAPATMQPFSSLGGNPFG